MEDRRRLPSALLAAVACAIAGCASAPPADTQAAAAAVKVYKLGELAAPDYQVVSRLWAGASSNAYRLPAYRTEDEAVAAMRAEAARVNANGVINVLCLKGDADLLFQGGDPAFRCYGLAVRVGKSAG